MAGQFPYSNASGEIILKGILQKLEITISQLEKETGLSYSLLQRIYNGETKKITIPVYEALKSRYPSLRDEYLKNATLPIFIDEESDDPDSENDVDIISILNSARQILKSAERKEDQLKEKERMLKDWETRLEDRSKILDQRATDLDTIMKMVVARQIELTQLYRSTSSAGQENSISDNELAEKLSDNKEEQS